MQKSIQYFFALGEMLEVALSPYGVVSAQFVQKISCENIMLEVPELVLQGTPFQKLVWQAAMKIPAGSTMTYQELARAIGKPASFRAVANVLANNKIAYFIPCHRVIRKNGELGGYKWGIERKRALLQAEKARIML